MESETIPSGMPILFGATYSVYTRIARLALGEKGVRHTFSEVDVFAPAGLSEDYLARQPFGRIPAFEHDGFRLYETGAITRYVDEVFPGPPLQPAEPRARARMDQVISIMDHYGYRTMVWDVFVERVRVPQRGGTPEEAKIAAALERSRTCLAALEGLLADGPWLAGPALSLADLHAAPMFFLFRLAPEGARLLAGFSGLTRWLATVAARPVTRETRSPIETA